MKHENISLGTKKWDHTIYHVKYTLKGAGTLIERKKPTK